MPEGGTGETPVRPRPQPTQAEDIGSREGLRPRRIEPLLSARPGPSRSFGLTAEVRAACSAVEAKAEAAMASPEYAAASTTWAFSASTERRSCAGRPKRTPTRRASTSSPVGGRPCAVERRLRQALSHNRRNLVASEFSVPLAEPVTARRPHNGALPFDGRDDKRIGEHGPQAASTVSSAADLV